MPSQNKLIKQGLKYTDSLFDEIDKRLKQGVKASDTLEAFLDKYHKAFPDNDNPLLALRYDTEMLKLILSETNNHKFTRPAQKELVRVTIESRVGELIRDVGEDIRDSVRDVVRDGYNDNLSQDEIAANLTDKVSSIKGRRAKAIARTEIARTATISDYVINAERGATHFYVECRNTACPICKEAWHKHWSKSNDESFNPHETSAGGKGWIGDKVYSMSDTMMLPPVHPNCRCVPYFISEDDIPEGISVEKPTPKETTVTTPNDTEPVTQNPRIAELEKEIEETQALADKWRKRGNANLAGTFESSVKKLKEELETLKNPTTTESQQKPEDTAQNDLINNILSDVLKDVGLEDIAPEKKSIKPDVKIEKNIKTTHESNLWENLAEKHGFELMEASNTKVTFYDPKFETPIQCNIPKNNDWIDYENRGRKNTNIEDILTSYNSATPIQKKATPIIKLQGSSIDHGRVTISRGEFYLELFEGAFHKPEGSINGGNLKGTMHHEMWHCVDIRMTPEQDARVLYILNSNRKGSDYKKTVTKDRRAKKKTGGQTFVSTYARQSGDRKLYEDFAESGSVMSSDTYLVQDALKGKGYIEITKEEFKKLNPNRAKYFEDLMENGELLW